MTTSSVQTISESPTQEEIRVGCSMGGLLEMLTRPWTLHILWLLSRNGPMRFGALRRSIAGISARLLTVRLRTLEKRGFVERSVRATNPPEVTYIPTARLTDMELFMHQLHLLSARWQAQDATKHAEAHPKPTPAKRRVA